MKCTISFITVLVLVISTLILVCSILLFTPASCPNTSFMCDQGDQCFNLRYRCDGKQHCSDGSDELAYKCVDLTTLLLLTTPDFPSNVSLTTTITPRTTTEQSCSIKMPIGCSCRNGNFISCYNLSWNSINWSHFDSSTVRLVLVSVLTNDWKENGRLSMNELKILTIENNAQMKTFPKNFLKDKVNVKKLFLENNAFEKLDAYAFSKMHQLHLIFLSGNQIKTIEKNAFIGLESLVTLDLSNNSIDLEPMFNFDGMLQLQALSLQHNRIRMIHSGLLRNLQNLRFLNLGFNYIKSIHSRAFVYNEKLFELNLSGNLLISIHSDTFYGLGNLIKLSIADNPISWISSSLFKYTPDIQSLELQGIALEYIDLQIFTILRNLSFVHFKKFEYCLQVAPRIPNCRPIDISSMKNLLTDNSSRICVWMLGFTIVTGNLFVISSRWKSKNAGILNIFIKNLAVADFFTGVYLGVIGLKDLLTRGEFYSYAFKWNNSFVCKILEVLVTVSTEMSLLILTLMSFERYVVISSPYTSNEMSRKWAIASMALLWIFSMLIAITPVLMWDVVYHGTSGFCVTLHLHDPFASGWIFNAFVLIGLNSLCLIAIATCCGRLFRIIRQTTSLTPTIPTKDLEVALRFFFMVITDFLSWTPIIILKLCVLKGFHVPDTLLTWMTLFVLPLNSALHPLLYTLFSYDSGNIRIERILKLFQRWKIPSRSVSIHQESDEKLAPPETTEDSKFNGSQDWRKKSDQSETISMITFMFQNTKQHDVVNSNIF